MKRALLIGVAAVVLVVGGVGVFLYLSADSIVKATVEEVGSRATQTKVTLDSVKLSLASGEGALNGFRMGNPEGFKTESAMRFGIVSVKLDIGSLTQDAILIKEVVIAAPQITYELGAGGGSNIAAIQKNVDAFAKSMAAGQGGAKPAADKADEGKKVIIENLYIRDGKIGVAASMLGDKRMDAPLPTIHLKDIGKDKGGASPAEVADRILTSISQSAAKVVGSLGVDKMMDKAKEGAAGATKAIEDRTQGVGDKVKGLFGR